MTAVVLAADADAVVDLTESLSLSTVSVRGGGRDATLQPIGATGVEVVPITTRLSISATGWAGDTMDDLAAVDEGVVAVLLLPAAVGWLSRGRWLDVPGVGAQQDWPSEGLSTVTLAHHPTALHSIVTAAHKLDGSTAVTVGAASVTVIATTGGTLGGKTVRVGWQVVTGLTAGSPSAVSGTVGWALETAAPKVGS